MKKNLKTYLKDTMVSVIILLAIFSVSLAIHIMFDTRALIPALFVLAVFLVSMYTNGYVYGIAAALISVSMVNYAFTFPFFRFNFTLHENIISAVILIIVTVATSTLTTKIKRQEKLKLQAEEEKMRANLLRAISHDLRTPLTSIYGSASTVIENYDALPKEMKIDILSGIQSDSQWLIRMVENLLSITKIDNSNVRIFKSAVVLEELVDSVLAKFKKNFPQQKVELDMPEEFISINADAMLIEQTLLNILENAVIHAKGMTELKMRIFTENSKIYFEITDDGCGVEKEQLKNIFAGYYKGSGPASDSTKKNMGIGLSVCAAIIRAHGGEIQAKNLKKGGMQVRFYLELEEADYE